MLFYKIINYFIKYYFLNLIHFIIKNEYYYILIMTDLKLCECGLTLKKITFNHLKCEKHLSLLKSNKIKLLNIHSDQNKILELINEEFSLNILIDQTPKLLTNDQTPKLLTNDQTPKLLTSNQNLDQISTHYILPNISIEQQNIIELLKNNNNVIVESVAGSGKTTSNLYIAKSFNEYKILLLTYNAKLKIETREKIEKLKINNLETHSYHSFCVKYYNNECFTDNQIIKLLQDNTKPFNNFNYNLLILDEAQDINPLYFELICKIYKDCKEKLQICLLGDRYQSIYDFNNADSRYITLADKIFKLNNLEWKFCKLSQSYRITNKMSDFINNCLMNSSHILSNKISENKPRYIICNSFSKNINSVAFKEVKYYLDLGYKPEEMFILAPSVKSLKSPVRTLENLIKTELKNILVYVPSNDDEKLDNDILKNKLVFSTFHQAKGLERKVVIIFNFDDSYFKFYKSDKNSLICPNEYYVATTRASEHLTLLHDYKNNYFEFINIEKLKKYCVFLQYDKIKCIKQSKVKNIDTEVVALLRHLPIEITNECMTYLDIKIINKPLNKKIDILTKIGDDSQNNYENVSDITGVAIPAYFELKNKNKMTIFNESLEYYSKCDNKKNPLFKPSKNYDLTNINLEKIKPDELLYIANYYCSIRNGFLFKLYQINNYDWLTNENLEIAINRISNLKISKNTEYEVYFELENVPELFNRRLKGCIDCIDIENNSIYEFKCTNKLENEHILQLAIYMYLFEKKNKIKYNYYLYNILSNEHLQVKCELNDLIKMINYIIKSKYIINKEINYSDFLILNDKILSKYHT
jgi:hypothetical protein